MLQKESQVVTGASLRKGLVQAIPVCVRLASCAMSMSALLASPSKIQDGAAQRFTAKTEPRRLGEKKIEMSPISRV
jgi:hypothetical protein